MITDDANADLRYDDVKVILLDPNLRMRTLLRGALLSVGFRHIRECRSTDDVIGSLTAEPADFLVLDLDADTDRVCQFVRDLREGLIGTNPYVVVTALTWAPERAMISRTLQAGTDDLIAKPVSPNVIATRTANLVRNRKDFVVTTTYVGPDRRSPDRHVTGDLPLITVPNTLRFKATGDVGADLNPDSLRKAQSEVNSHRVYRLSVEIANAAMSLELQLAENAAQSSVEARYRELTRKASEVNRLIAREKLEHLQRLGESLEGVVTQIIQRRSPTAQHLEVLRLHSQAIAATIHDNEIAADIIATALDQATEIVNARADAAAA